MPNRLISTSMEPSSLAPGVRVQAAIAGVDGPCRWLARSPRPGTAVGVTVRPGLLGESGRSVTPVDGVDRPAGPRATREESIILVDGGVAWGPWLIRPGVAARGRRIHPHPGVRRARAPARAVGGGGAGDRLTRAGGCGTRCPGRDASTGSRRRMREGSRRASPQVPGSVRGPPARRRRGGTRGHH